MTGKTIEQPIVTKWTDGYEPAALSDEDTNTVLSAFQKLSEAAELTAKSAEIRAQAREQLSELYLTSGISEISLAGIGRASVYQGSNTRTDINKLCEYLVLKHGVDPLALKAAREQATVNKQHKQLTVKYNQEKGRAGGKGGDI